MFIMYIANLGPVGHYSYTLENQNDIIKVIHFIQQ